MPAGDGRHLAAVFSALAILQSARLLPPVAAVVVSPAPGVRSPPSAELVRALEASLLNVFGLKTTPRPTGQHHVPPYMLDMYDRQRGGVRRPGSVRRPPHGANTLRSFYHKDVDTLAGDDDSSAENSQLMFFDVSSMSTDELLRAAELRLYRVASPDHGSLPAEAGVNTTTVGVNKTAGVPLHHRHRIDVYEVLTSPRPSDVTRPADVIRRLIDTRAVDARVSAWETFDVWPAVQRWRRQRDRSGGLLVDFVTATGHAPRVRHVRLRRSLAETDARWAQRRPLLVTYTDDRRGPHRRPAAARRQRGARRTRRGARRRNRQRKRGRKRKQNQKQKGHCARKPLYVDFGDVGWNNWIIAPLGYSAYYCAGECPFYLPDHLNSTNHAIVQTLVNLVDSKAVPVPCCVPTQLSDISMLYIDEYGETTLKNYQDMVVEACGCR